jgi:hypothetical protein
MTQRKIHFEGIGKRPYQFVRYGHAKQGEFWHELGTDVAYLAHSDLLSDHWIAKVKS